MSRVIRASFRFAACWLALVAPLGAAAGEIDWLTDLPRALEQSAATGKPIVVDVWAVWCVPCRQMDETTYRESAVVESLAGFVPLKLDADISQTFLERHRVDAFPTVLVLDDAGREITRLLGFVSAQRLVGALGPVHDGYAGYRAAMRESGKDPAAALNVAGYLQAAGNPFGAGSVLRRTLKGAKDLPPATRDRLELALAEAQLASDDLRPPTDAFSRLAEHATEPEVRGRALAGLVHAERKRGRTEDAERALARLRQDYPELAAAFDR